MYREPGLKLDAGQKIIIERLGRLEEMMRETIRGPRTALSTSPSSQNPESGKNMKQQDPLQTNPPTMPRMYQTPTLNLLQWPVIRDLVAKSYEPQQLLRLELSRKPLDLASHAQKPLDLRSASLYIRAFFNSANTWSACVDPYDWSRCYRTALARRFHEGVESCVTLLVLALGAAAHADGSVAIISSDVEPPGLVYFAHAWRLLQGMTTCNDVLACQCLSLGSAYLSYLVRPIEAWSLLSSMNLKLQLLIGNPSLVPTEMKELSGRLYWNALLSESSLLAELDLPPSGITHLEGTVDLPSGFQAHSLLRNSPDVVPDRDGLWYFLAEIALHRLLSQASHVTHTNLVAHRWLATFGPTTADLDSRLQQWYEQLPEALQFPLERTPSSDPVQTVLRMQYFACRALIYRPYVLAVLESEAATSAGDRPAKARKPQSAALIEQPAVRDACHKGLEAALRQLEHATAHHARHMPYLWQSTLNLVRQALLVMGASRSVGLAALLPEPRRLDAVLAAVVTEVGRHARLAPSLRLAAEILCEAEERRMVLLRAAGMRE